MTVQIFIKRSVTVSFQEGLDQLLRQMRTACLRQPGYVSGQTLKRLDKPGEFLVISTWQSLEHWDAWFTNSERQEIQLEIDLLLGQETTYEIYG